MTQVHEIPLGDIGPSPYQPRTTFPMGPMQELALSIAKDGVFQPIVVRPTVAGPAFELIMGERRWRASRLAGKATIPALVKVVDDVTAERMALVENLARQDLTDLDQAETFERLRSTGMTVGEVAITASKSVTYVEYRLRLLNLKLEYLDMLRSGLLKLVVAGELARLPKELQQQGMRLIARVRDANQLSRAVSAMLETPEPMLLDPGEQQRAGDALEQELDKVARALDRIRKGRLVSKIGTAGRLDKALQLSALCHREFQRVLDEIRDADGRRVVDQTKSA